MEEEALDQVEVESGEEGELVGPFDAFGDHFEHQAVGFDHGGDAFALAGGVGVVFDNDPVSKQESRISRLLPKSAWVQRPEYYLQPCRTRIAKRKRRAIREGIQGKKVPLFATDVSHFFANLIHDRPARPPMRRPCYVKRIPGNSDVREVYFSRWLRYLNGIPCARERYE